ncbi:hypothetical protein ACGLWX_05935 [Halomonas sp. HMF6819]|uniref:hypothetical protein n=1 Tax=Halomonas sp. HMF6819 TaxID=3373085 RepID=UPI0037B13D27
MRQLLIDTLGLAGFGALNYGLYLRFGLADALITGGALLLVLALVATRAAKRAGGGHAAG